jgi:hypothetical protein
VYACASDTLSRDCTAAACPAAAASHRPLLPLPSTAAAKSDKRWSCAQERSASIAEALPQCAATCKGVAALASVCVRAAGRHEREEHAARSCRDGALFWPWMIAQIYMADSSTSAKEYLRDNDG